MVKNHPNGWFFYAPISNIRESFGIQPDTASSVNPITDLNGVDLNSIKATSFYFANDDCPNRPTTTSGYLETITGRTGNYIKQIFTRYDNYDTYIRTKDNGTWQGWSLLLASKHYGDNYIRFNNGLQICYGCEVLSSTATSDMIGNLYIKTYQLSKPWPQSFTARPQLIITPGYDGDFVWGAIYGADFNSSRWLTVTTVRGNPFPSGSASFNWVAIGPWV